MLLNNGLLTIALAGIINASFVIPVRYIKTLTVEKVWLYHSILGLIVIPWLLLALISADPFLIYINIPSENFILLFVGGAIFGLGQISFANAIKTIGVALSFCINLGLGAIIGSLFVVIYNDLLFSTQGLIVGLALLLVLFALIAYYYARKGSSNNYSENYKKGWLFAVLAGFASGLQNVVFVLIFSVITFDNPFWIWPPFLSIAAIVMAIGFSLQDKQKYLPKVANVRLFDCIRNSILIFFMGLFFTGSLALYSRGMLILNETKEDHLGWPILMIAIILTSQVWGWYYSEFNVNCVRKKLATIVSIMLLIVAILLLSMQI